MKDTLKKLGVAMLAACAYGIAQQCGEALGEIAQQCGEALGEIAQQCGEALGEIAQQCGEALGEIARQAIADRWGPKPDPEAKP